MNKTLTVGELRELIARTPDHFFVAVVIDPEKGIVRRLLGSPYGGDEIEADYIEGEGVVPYFQLQAATPSDNQ